MKTRFHLQPVLFLFATCALEVLHADCVPSPSGLVAWWRAEGDASDSAGNNAGTPVGGVTFASGHVGQAFSFNASSDTGVIVPPASPLNPTEAITIEAWVRPSSFPNGAPAIVRKDQNAVGTTQYSLSVGNGVTTGIAVMNIGGAGTATGGSVPTNVWTHLAGTYDRQFIRLYINGVEVTNTAATSPIPTSTENLSIGRHALFTTRNFDGLIDEVSIYNRALSAGEIAGIFAAGTQGKCPPCAPVPDSGVAWWPAEGNAQDSTGANHGTVSGATFTTGQVGQAFNFDANDGISVADAANLRPVTNLTIEGWIKTPGISESALTSFVAARSGSGGVTGYEFGIGTPSQGGRLRFVLNGGSGGAGLFGTNSVTDDQFHHVAATYDGAALRVYRDGVCEAELPMTQLISYVEGDVLWIGRRQYAPIPGHFTGLIDELSIYNRALTANEILAIYTAGSAGKCGTRPMLNIAALPGAVRLTWTTNATGYLLETNSTLALPAGWGVLTSNYSLINTNYAVTNGVGGATRFYRLHKP